MPGTLKANEGIALEYARWFVNRRAYTLQSNTPHPGTGRHYYFRPRRGSEGLLAGGQVSQVELVDEEQPRCVMVTPISVRHVGGHKYVARGRL